METSTTVSGVLSGNRIFIPNYQRAYSWETADKSQVQESKQVNVFLSDLEEYNKSETRSKYYFGHFLFEEREENRFGVVDGQQRLTTIVIFLSALFKRLKRIRPLKDDEEVAFEDLIKRRSSYRFETVGYDDQFFKDYVIDNDGSESDCSLETVSATRIADAFKFFQANLEDKDEAYILKMLNTIKDAKCTTHTIEDESEAVQMFLFQNNRGKKPSKLEVLKAQFMFNVHLYGGEERENLLQEIKNRFEKIYKAISSIEHRIHEDNVLGYAIRVHFNSLREDTSLSKINRELADTETSIKFIRSFTKLLAESFNFLNKFYGDDEKENIDIHSFNLLGRAGFAMPFIIKAYKFNLDIKDINSLCNNFESIVLRHRLIGTRADIFSRLDDVYKDFNSENSSIKPITDRIQWMKNSPSTNWWWAYWNNDALKRSIQGQVTHATARFILWKYERYLRSNSKARTYTNDRYDQIDGPQLEHIAPSTENPKSGYDAYNEEFKTQYLNCLGNYLLISKTHNSSIGNKPFKDKRITYNYLEQQREVQEMTKEQEVWTKALIQERKEKIIDFILEQL